MPRPTIDVEPFKEQIIADLEAKMTDQTICDKLPIKITTRTLRRSLQRWGVRRQIQTTNDKELHDLVHDLVLKELLSDKEIMPILLSRGYPISTTTLQRLRRKLGLQRRTDDPLEQQRQTHEIYRVLTRELQSGAIDGFGRTLIYRHLRRAGYLFPRDRVYEVYRQLREDRVIRRPEDPEYAEPAEPAQ